MDKVLILLPHIGSLRDIAGANLLNKLPKHIKVVLGIFMLNPDQEFFKHLPPNIEIKYFGNQQINGRFKLTFLGFLQNIGWELLYSISRSETIEEKLVAFQTKRFTSIKNLLNYLIVKSAWHVISLLRPLSIIRNLYSFIANNNQQINSIKEMEVDKVLVFDPFSIYHQKVVMACERLNIKSFGLIRSWDNLTCKGILFNKYDNFFVWNNEMQQEVVRYYGVDIKNIIRIGNLGYEIISPKLYSDLKPIMQDTQKKVVFMLAYPDNVPDYIEHVKEILQIIKNNKLKVKLDIRIQPGPRSKGVLERLQELKENNDFSIDHDKEFLNQKNLSNALEEYQRYFTNLKSADFIINYPSTTIVDAALFNVPCLTICFDNEKEYFKSIKRYKKRTHFAWLSNYNLSNLANNQNELEGKMIDIVNSASKVDLIEKSEEFLSVSAGSSSEVLIQSLFKGNAA